jgi:hypothetical protein
MIGSVEKLIKEDKVRNAICPECQAPNSLKATVYSKIFVLKLFPFVYGKTAKVDCTECKRAFPNYKYLPMPIQGKVDELMKDIHHKWYGYIGYVVFGAIILFGLLNPKK